MRKLLFTILSCIALMPLCLMAQDQANSFKKKYMEQTKENAAAQAKVTAAILRKKYYGDVAMEKALYQVLYQGRLEIEQTSITYAQTPELEGRLLEVINKNDSITQIYLNVAISKAQPEGNSKFADAVRSRNELSLTQVQVDSLMYHNQRLKELRLSNSDFKPRDYEQKVLPRILKDAQYTYLLVKLNKAQAIKNGQSDWKEIKQRGLLPSADSVKVVNEIMTYNIGMLSISDRYTKTEPRSESMNALLTAIPQATQLLLASKSKDRPDGNSKFAVAVRLRNELSLNQVQIDSLWYHNNRLKGLLLSNKDFKQRDYEREVLPKILKDPQYTNLLVNFNKAQALKNGQSDWKVLKQHHLLPGADSAKVVHEMMTYNIGVLSLSDRYITTEPQSESMKALLTPIPQATKLLIVISEQQKAAFKW